MVSALPPSTDILSEEQPSAGLIHFQRHQGYGLSAKPSLCGGRCAVTANIQFQCSGEARRTRRSALQQIIRVWRARLPDFAKASSRQVAAFRTRTSSEPRFGPRYVISNWS